MRPDQPSSSAGASTRPGGFFALRSGSPPPEGAVPLSVAYARDAAPLTARIARVGERLGTRETRVAASLTHQGLASRLWSVALAAAVLDRRLPASYAPGSLHWSPSLAAPDDLWRTAEDAGGPPLRPEELSAGLVSLVCAQHLVPLTAAVRRAVPVSEKLLWGNAASALAGALGQLLAWCAEQGREGDAQVASFLAGSLLEHDRLRGAGTLDRTGFSRATCCLYYRTGGGLCGDCVFRGTGAPRLPNPR